MSYDCTQYFNNKKDYESLLQSILCTQYFGVDLLGPAVRMWFSDFLAGSQVMAEIIKGSL